MWPRTWCSLSRHSWSRTLSLRNFRPTAPAVTSFPSGKPWCLSIKSNKTTRFFGSLSQHIAGDKLWYFFDPFPQVHRIHHGRTWIIVFMDLTALFFVSRAPGSLSQKSPSLSFEEFTCSIFAAPISSNFHQFPQSSLYPQEELGYILNFDLSLCADVIFNYHFAGWGLFWDHVHTSPYHFAGYYSIVLDLTVG